MRWLPLMLALLALPARAARMSVLPAPEGAPKGAVVIALSGPIAPGDAAAFAALAAAHPVAMVVFSGEEGDVPAALQIGRLIRLRHDATAVPDGETCVGACALAWLGGDPRLLGATGRVGFHAARAASPRADPATASPAAVQDALTGAFMAELGLPLDAIAWLVAAPPGEADWLSPAEAARLGIAVTAAAPEDAPPHDAPPRAPPPARPDPPAPARP